MTSSPCAPSAPALIASSSLVAAAATGTGAGRTALRRLTDAIVRGGWGVALRRICIARGRGWRYRTRSHHMAIVAARPLRQPYTGARTYHGLFGRAGLRSCRASLP